MAKLPKHQTNRRGITVDEYLRMAGTDGSIFAVGDCTATSYAPTAQVANQQGRYLARVFEQLAKRDALQQRLQAIEAAPVAEEAKAEKDSVQKQLAKAEKLRPFHYSHQGSLAYIGSEKAIADLPFFNGNVGDSSFCVVAVADGSFHAARDWWCGYSTSSTILMS